MHKLVYAWTTFPFLLTTGLGVANHVCLPGMGGTIWLLGRFQFFFHGWCVSSPQLIPGFFPPHRRGRNIDTLNFSDDKSEVMSSIPGTLGTLGRPSWDELQLVQQRCSANEGGGHDFVGEAT